MNARKDHEPNAHALGDPEQYRIARQHLFQQGGQGALVSGSIALAGHAVAQKFWPTYRNKFYVVGKALLISSAFVVGFWVRGEEAYISYMRNQAEKDGRMR